MDGLADWIANVMEALGAPGAGLLILLENIFPPLPSEAVLPLAGFAASQDSMGLAAAIAFTTAGSVIGAVILYYVGALLGRERTRAIAAKLPLVKMSDIDRTEALFVKYETSAVFFGRLIPIFRSLISIPAGVERMPLHIFIGLTALGSFIWNTALIFAGYLLGSNWHVVEEYVGVFQKVIIVLVIGAVAYFIFSRLKKRGQKKG